MKNYLEPMVRANNGVFPHEQKTTAIEELLARGWVHEDDSDLDKKNRYWIECHIAPLVWNEDFELHQDAIKKMGEIGIPGYVGTKMPSKK